MGDGASSYEGEIQVNEYENPFLRRTDESLATDVRDIDYNNDNSNSNKNKEEEDEDEDDVIVNLNGSQVIAVDDHDEDVEMSAPAPTKKKQIKSNTKTSSSSNSSLSTTTAPSRTYSESELRQILKQHFGFSSFRPGQLETIQRILSGLSTLLIVPTGNRRSNFCNVIILIYLHCVGSGKSLCYQLPAYLLDKGSICLVVSPLLSLIQDQLANLPACITGATLTSQQSVIPSIRCDFLINYYYLFCL